MKGIIMSTKDNLQEAFAGESQANRKYLAFAKKADQDNFKQVARLFRAAAAAETIHAHAHLRAMGGIKTTLENLEEAKGGEEYEFNSMYPGFVAEAETEGNKAALITFKNAMAVENIHAGLYGEAIEAVKAGQDLPETAIYVCEICGNTVYGEAPDKCEICGVPKERFFAVE
jgi:rubrerythrin